MNDIQILNYNNQSIRQTVTEDGEILFCAKDVLSALGTATKLKDIELDDPDGGVLDAPILDSMGRIQKAKFITEPTLYEILGKLNIDTVKPFRRWVTHEVLPSIRRTGSYSVNGLLLPNDAPESLKALCREYIDLKAKIDELEPLAKARKKTLKQREDYYANPKRKYDVEVRYSNGKTSWIRTFPPDVAVFFQRLHSPSEVGKILEEASAVRYIRNTIMPRYNRKHKRKNHV